jgi:hypothetical protein
MSTSTQTHRPIPIPQFRVLIIGRANAGKTSILQRVCDTTKSPTIYRRGERSRKDSEKVHRPNFVCEFDLTAYQVKINPSIDVGNNHTSLRLLIDVVPARRTQLVISLARLWAGSWPKLAVKSQAKPKPRRRPRAAYGSSFNFRRPLLRPVA